MKKLYLFIIIGIVLVAGVIAGVTNIISSNISVDKTTKDTYTAMGIQTLTLSKMDEFGNIKVYNKGIELFQVNVPLTYCSKEEIIKDEEGDIVNCLEYSDYTKEQLEPLIRIKVQESLDKLRNGYEKQQSETTKASLIDGGTINIVEKK